MIRGRAAGAALRVGARLKLEGCAAQAIDLKIGVDAASWPFVADQTSNPAPPMTGLGHKHALAAGPAKVCSRVVFRQICLRADALESH
jgi:hypothetical protein